MMTTESSDQTGFTIETPPTALTKDRRRAVLTVRLALAVNALRASHRHYIAVKDAPGPGGERDRMWAFLSAAAFVKEGMNILSGTRDAPPEKVLVEELARKSGATDESVSVINRLLAGTHPMSGLVTRVRNKLAFHWDPQPISEWIDHFDKETVVWLDATAGPSNGDTVYRAAADAVSFSILPPTEEELALPSLEQTEAVRQRFIEGLGQLTGVMTALADYFERAIATYLREVGATAKPASLPPQP